MIRRILALSLFAAAILSLGEPSSHATPAPVALDAGTSDADPADAGASDAGPPPPPFDAEPIPTEESPAPKPDEWRAAKPVSLTRDFSACHAYRVREWIKVDCADLTPAGIAQVAGPTEGVALFIAPTHKSNGDEIGDWWQQRMMEVIFPLRRGAGHVFQLLEIGAGYEGPESAALSLTLADSWTPGDAPIITLH